jgi:hypothetical protein
MKCFIKERMARLFSWLREMLKMRACSMSILPSLWLRWETLALLHVLMVKFGGIVALLIRKTIVIVNM